MDADLALSSPPQLHLLFLYSIYFSTSLDLSIGRLIWAITLEPNFLTGLSLEHELQRRTCTPMD